MRDRIIVGVVLGAAMGVFSYFLFDKDLVMGIVLAIMSIACVVIPKKKR